MKKAEILSQLNPIFREVLGDDSIVLHPELSAKEVDGWDSLTHIRLILTVEKAFAVSFSASEIGQLNNVGQLADLIASKSGSQSFQTSTSV